MNDETNKWAVALHLSQFAGYLIPFAGAIAPIAIWLIKKDDMPALDAHGRMVVNWLISSLIYWGVAIALTMIVIGIPLVIAMSIVVIVFPIVGAVKASDGTVWKYPGTISFL